MGRSTDYLTPPGISFSMPSCVCREGGGDCSRGGVRESCGGGEFFERGS